MTPSRTLLAPLLAIPLHAAVFDFSESGSISGNNSTGASGNVNVADASVTTIAPTIDGVQLTLTATTGSGTPTIGANGQGFGVSTNGESGANDTRLEADKDETFEISFDTDVTLDSLRFGNFGNGEVVTIALVSGSNPFTSGTSLTLTGNGSQGPATDIVLASNPIVSGGIGVISAGTVLSVSLNTGAQDALLNEFTVSAVTPPSKPPSSAASPRRTSPRIRIPHPTSAAPWWPPATPRDSPSPSPPRPRSPDSSSNATESPPRARSPSTFTRRWTVCRGCSPRSRR